MSSRATTHDTTIHQPSVRPSLASINTIPTTLATESISSDNAATPTQPDRARKTATVCPGRHSVLRNVTPSLGDFDKLLILRHVYGMLILRHVYGMLILRHVYGMLILRHVYGILSRV
jgi:hypothetical protein